MSMLAAKDENDAEVRREDQENINRFARLNARLAVVRSEGNALKVCACACVCVRTDVRVVKDALYRRKHSLCACVGERERQRDHLSHFCC